MPEMSGKDPEVAKVMTHEKDAERQASSAEALATQDEVRSEAPWLRRFPLLSPTLPPATHTNAYLLGQGELLLVDPGAREPAVNERMLERIAELRRQGERVSGIFLTHHHHDHMAGAAYFKEQLAVPVYAHPLTAERVSRRGFSVENMVHEGALLPFSRPGSGFRALHTPGHAPGHLCLLDEAGGGIIAGDMVASIGTIVIAPMDDGDMGIYIESLERLAALCAEHEARTGEKLRLWPAHGASVPDGEKLLRFYITNRRKREALVLEALRGKPAQLSDLLPVVYADKPDADPRLAVLSLLAHLQKLLREGRVQVDDGVWSAFA